MKLSKDPALVVGLAIPLVMILFVALSIYIPRFFAHPKYNFLYTNGQGYSGSTYFVENNKLVTSPPTPTQADTGRGGPLPIPPVPAQEEHIYLHDVTTNTSKEISLTEAQVLHLDPNQDSPDNYRVVSGMDGSNPIDLFSSPNYNQVFLKGHSISEKLRISNPSSVNSYYSFHFLGWVIK